MHFAFVLYHYFPYGGLQRDCLNIIRACRARGADITVYTMQWQGEAPAGVNIVLIEARGWWRQQRLADFIRRVQEHTRQGNYSAVIGFNRMPGLDVYFAADSCFAEKALRQRGALYRLTPRCRQLLAHERAIFSPPSRTQVLFISALQRQQFLNHYPDCAARSCLLPPGIARDRGAGEDAPLLRRSLRNEFSVRDNEVLVLQVGSGFAVKGVDRSLRALAALPEQLRGRVRFMLVGQDKPQRYLRLAARLGIADKVQVLKGRDDIPRFLQGADLLLHPAYSESAGLVLAEALVAGLPAVTTASCGYAAFIEEARAGIVVPAPFRQEVLNQALVEMMDAKRRTQSRQQALDYAAQHDFHQQAEVVADWLTQTAPDTGLS